MTAVFNNNPPIIAPEIFDQVQKMREERSNISLQDDGTRTRKSSRYTSKTTADRDEETGE